MVFGNMAAPLVATSHDKKRVKVYELKSTDWFDRGTGFCTGRTISDTSGNEEAKIYVESEDEPERLLLETRIGKDDGYQKQQGEYDCNAWVGKGPDLGTWN